MAEIRTDAEGMAIVLGRWEAIGGLHRSIRVPWGAVSSVEFVDDLWRYLRGIRAPGTGFPVTIMLGTMRYRGGKDYCNVYGRKPGVIISLTGHKYERILVTARSAPDLAHWQALSLHG